MIFQVGAINAITTTTTAAITTAKVSTKLQLKHRTKATDVNDSVGKTIAAHLNN